MNAIRIAIGAFFLSLAMDIYPPSYTAWLKRAINHEYEAERTAKR